MSNSVSSITALGLALTVVACGSAPAPKGASSAKDDGVLRPITQAQLAVAHYATADGSAGFVLDRTHEPAKLKMDGAKDVVELTKVEERDGWGKKGTFYKAPDGKNLVFIGAGGDVQLLSAGERSYANSDAPAEPLGKATVTGQWSQPKSAKDLASERLAGKSVVTKLGMKAEDSSSLAKVDAAITSAPKEMFVRLTKEGAATAKWTPEGRQSYGDGSEGEETWSAAKTGYGRFGGRLVPNMMEFGRPNRLHTRAMRGWTTSPPVGTPGLVWSVDGSLVTFVTVDGGRYTLWLPDGASAFEDGAGPTSSWPAPLAHGLLSVSDVHEMAKAGVVAKATADELNTLDDGWFECIAGVWKKASSQIEAVERSSAPMNEKYGKASGIGSAAIQDAPKTCAPAKKALEDGLVKVMEARSVERKAIHAKARAKLE